MEVDGDRKWVKSDNRTKLPLSSLLRCFVVILLSFGVESGSGVYCTSSYSLNSLQVEGTLHSYHGLFF